MAEKPFETPCRQMGREELIEVIRSEGSALAATARAQPEQSVPRYPGWSMVDLIAHTGSIHRRTLVVLLERSQQPVPRQYPDPGTESSAPALVDWFEEGVRRLCEAFEATDPSTPLWSISDDRTAGFWLVRMALETAVHRTDADAATGLRPSLKPDLAVCGIEEIARLHMPGLEDVEVGGPSRSVLLVTEDRRARWLFTLSPGAIRMARTEDAEADAVVSAPASDLYLALTRRGELPELQRSGDPEAVRSLVSVVRMIPDAKR
jgi:uncharacterized protein (TIGR03083 family)